MNLTWHIVKKDLRAMRWPLLLWALVIVARLGIGVMLLNAEGTEGVEWFNKMDSLAKMLGAIEFVSFVLTAAIVQQDLLVGTTAFWMTRPISGARLLRAKLLCLGLVFLVGPVLVNLLWWLGCGYGGSELAWAAAETVAVQAIAVLFGLLWSVVTDGFARFLLWALLSVFATPMLTAIVAYYAGRSRISIPSELVATRFCLILLLVVVGILVVAVHQYVTRNFSRSVAIIAGIVGLIVLTGALWPWSWKIESRLYSYALARAQGEWLAAAEPAGLTFTRESAEFSARRDRPNRPGNLTAKYRVAGLAASQGLMPVASEHRLRWADGTSEEGRTMGRGGLPEMMAGKALGNLPPAGVEMSHAENLTYTSMLPASAMVKVRAEAPVYVLPARFRLMKFTSATEVPAKAGEWQRMGSSRERIAQVEKDGAQLLVTFVRHSPGLWIENIGGGPISGSGDYFAYFLVNPARQFVDRGSPADQKQTQIGTVMITWRTMAYVAMPRPAGNGISLAAINALDDAKLVKVTLSEQARFVHELSMTPAEIEAAKP